MNGSGSASQSLKHFRLILGTVIWLPQAVFWLLLLWHLPNPPSPHLLLDILHRAKWALVMIGSLAGSLVLSIALVPTRESAVNRIRQILTRRLPFGSPITSPYPAEVPRFLAVMGLILFITVLLRNAWICDDIFLTLRTIDNFVNGRGLTWNVDERVQVFTHPLWLFCLIPAYALTSKAYFSAIVLAIPVTTFAAYILFTRFPVSVVGLTSIVLGCTLSKAFMDFSTSGLENPLTHLILVIFSYLLISRSRRFEVLSGIALLVSAASLNREDSILLFLPALGYEIYHYVKKTGGIDVSISEILKALGLALMPWTSWHLFSIWYYGYPFPNTALAKLACGIPISEFVSQGFVYLANSLAWDPVTLVVIVSALICAFRVRGEQRGRLVSLSSGVCLYLVYVVSIGGDFMSGRFLAAPFFLSTIILSQSGFMNKYEGIAVLALVALVGVTNSRSPIYSDPGQINKEFREHETGIADERLFYFGDLGLMNEFRHKEVFEFPQPDSNNGVSESCTTADRRHSIEVRVCGACGRRAFLAGPKVHYIDDNALGDPLLSRLECVGALPWKWRIGHFNRVIPSGYKDSIVLNKNMIQDSPQGIRAFYEDVRTMTRGDLLDRERMKVIVNRLLARRPSTNFLSVKEMLGSMRIFRITDLCSQPETQNARESMIVGRAGAIVRFDGVKICPQLEISLEHNDKYAITFRKEDLDLFKVFVGEKKNTTHAAMMVHKLIVPEAVRHVGYDSITVVPVDGDEIGAVGRLRLVACGAGSPLIETPATIRFSDDTASPFLGVGWSGKEEWGRWTDASRAFVGFRLENVPARNDLTLELRGHLFRPEQRISIFLNNQVLGTFSATDFKKEALTAPLPRDTLRHENLIEVQIVDPVSPKDLGLSEDNRKLGLGVKSMLIRPNE